MDSKRTHVYKQAARAAVAARAYTEHYVGAGWWYKLKRIARYRYTYLSYVWARSRNSHRVTTAHTFFGKEMQVLVGDRDTFELRAFGTLGADEYKLTNYLIKHLPPDAIFYDIGANYGFYSLLATELIDSGEVHTFEPLPQIYALTRQTLAPYPQCQVNQLAVSDTAGTATLHSFAEAGISGISSLVVSEHEYVAVQEQSITVDTTTLDTYVKSHQPPTFCKIDVEGAEALVIAGARETLQTYRPTISLEVWGGERRAQHSVVIQSLFELGYTAHALTEAGDIEPISDMDSYLASLPGFANCIFLS